MSRPAPSIICVATHNDKQIEVLEAPGVYAVFYQDKPFNLRVSEMFRSYPGPKYKRMAFTNEGNAFTAAKKLNKLFKTTDFTVVLMHGATSISR